MNKLVSLTFLYGIPAHANELGVIAHLTAIKKYKNYSQRNGGEG